MLAITRPIPRSQEQVGYVPEAGAFPTGIIGPEAEQVTSLPVMINVLLKSA